MQLRFHQIVPMTLFAYSNWLDPTPDGANGVVFWFIYVLLQIYLIGFVLCALPFVRRSLRAAPLATCLAVLGTGVLTSAFGKTVWDTEYLYNLLPHSVGWQFAAGACLYYLQDKKLRLPASIVLIALAAWLAPGLSVKVWVVLGGLFMIWVPRVAVPQSVGAGLSALASASLFVYLTHGTTFGFAEKVFARGGIPFQIAAALAVGIGAWMAFDKLWEQGGKLRARFAREERASA
jgi:peptidoglycan/LPS O-acetylase OafA/YrhL